MTLKCDTCRTVFKTEPQMKLHMSSKPHLKMEEDIKNEDKKIYIGAFPKTFTKPIVETHFSQYGEIASIYLSKRAEYKANFGFVTFKSEEAVKKVLSCAHDVNGSKIDVRPCNRSRGFYNREQDKGMPREEIVEKLKGCKSIAEQVPIFLDATVLAKDDISKRNEVCSDVAAVIREYYPNCHIYMYGSTSNGFGLKSSDIDLLFEPSPNYWDIDWSKTGGKTDVADLSIQNIEKGLIDKEVLEKQPPYVQVQFLYKIMRRNRDKFYKIMFIDARCPIVKFVHKKYSIPCDISCSNRLVLHNTRLLKFFGNIDKRVKQIMTVLRYWAKFVEVIRVGQMSSYAFSLLVVFFLQKTTPPVLPSVMYLRSKAGASHKDAGWECSFTENIRNIGRTTNCQSLEDLIASFFDFYAHFDFGNVISILNGKVMEREAFNDLTNEQEQNFKTAPMCIQDPLECSRNVTAFSGIACLLKLKDEMKRASYEFKKACSPSATNSYWGISSLLQQRQPIEKPLDLIPFEHRFPTYGRGVTFTLLFRKDLKDCMSGFEQNKQRLLAKVASSLYNVFSHVAKFDAEIVDFSEHLPASWATHKYPLEDDYEMPSKKLLPPSETDDAMEQNNGHADNNTDKMETASSLPEFSDPELLISIQNVVSHNIWYQRSKSKKSPVLEESLNNMLKAEQIVTSQLMTDSTKLPHPLLFTCECHFYREESRDRLAFLLLPDNPSHNITALCQFSKFLIRDMLNHVLSDS